MKNMAMKLDISLRHLYSSSKLLLKVWTEGSQAAMDSEKRYSQGLAKHFVKVSRSP
jgi:hypothetical protein